MEPGCGQVYKSLPIWPLALKKGLIPTKEALSDEALIRKFYLSTVGPHGRALFACFLPGRSAI